MAISKLIFNGTTQMDVTATTATASSVQQGMVFTLANGTQATGALVDDTIIITLSADSQDSQLLVPSISDVSALAGKNLIFQYTNSGSACYPVFSYELTNSNQQLNYSYFLYNYNGNILQATKVAAHFTVANGAVKDSVEEPQTALIVEMEEITDSENRSIIIPSNYSSSVYQEIYNALDNDIPIVFELSQSGGPSTFPVLQVYISSDEIIYSAIKVQSTGAVCQMIHLSLAQYQVSFYQPAEFTTEIELIEQTVDGYTVLVPDASYSELAANQSNNVRMLFYLNEDDYTYYPVFEYSLDSSHNVFYLWYIWFTSNNHQYSCELTISSSDVVSVSYYDVYYNTSGTTAVASDVQSGKTFYNSTGRVTGTSTAIVPSGNIQITSSGTTDVTNYATASVVAGSVSNPTATKGTVESHSVEITPSVSSSTGYITGSTKTGTAVTVSASELVSGTYSVNSSGTADVTNYEEISVPSGTEGTPVATKSNVSNHAVTVTPSVTNTGGYISGSTKTGTAVSVSASELVSGTYTVDSSGTKDVTDYENISVPAGSVSSVTATKGTVTNHAVQVTPQAVISEGYLEDTTQSGTAVTVEASELVSGTLNITQNGTIDVTNYASANVNVAGNNAFSHTVETLPGGGEHHIITGVDISNDTVTAAHLEQGYTAHDAEGNAITGTVVMAPAPKKQVNFIDYDGTILYSYTAVEANALTELPANPSHTGLVAQGWNWTLAQIKAQLTDIPDGDVWVGQMYITQSGDTEIDVVFADAARLDPILTISVNGTITVDWGDGTTADTVTGTSLTTRQAVPHTYASAGNYTMVIHVESGEFTFYGSTSYLLLRKNTTANENKVYANCVRAIRIGNGITQIGENAFSQCYSLTSVTIPSTVASIGGNAFYICYSLTSITIPSGVTSIGNTAFGYCNSLTSITIPSNVISIGSTAFNYCQSLASVTIPSGVTSIGSTAFGYCPSLTSVTIPSSVASIDGSAFYSCYSLTSITIPSGVTSIGNTAFYNCCGVAEYHFLPTTPPSLGTSAFNGIPSDCKIYVPSASIADYQAATNWSAYASYMEGE